MLCRPRPVCSSRSGSTEATLLAVMCALGMMVAGGFYFFQADMAREVAMQAETDAVAAEKATRGEVEIQAETALAEAPREEVVELPITEPEIDTDNPLDDVLVSDVNTETEPSRVLITPMSRSERIAAHLEFGEFSNAIEVAKGEEDGTKRSELLQQIATAQMKIGDFDAAMGSIRGMPDHNVRLDARADHTAQQAMAGGSQADFTELISLIQSETNGMWEDIDGAGGTISQFQQGVHVDPTGVLALASAAEHSGRLKELGIEARSALLNGDLTKTSNLRVVSLTRLEEAVARRISEGKLPVESQRLMGGLTKITHIFVYPEDAEIVVAGPAESWDYNDNGVAIGTESGRPVLQLDDFVDVLRTFTGSGQKFFSCSIDPRPEGLKALKDYVNATSKRPLSPGGGVRNWTAQLQKNLGMQDIVYSGISPQSRVARVIIEADYRMKLIGIGKFDFDKGTKISSIFDLMNVEEQKSGKLDALRWWLTMKYDSVRHSSDGDAFEFVGSSVQCLSENQFLNTQGQQVLTGKSEGANLAFAQTFTSKYEELAKQDLVFADLRNVFDLALVASLLEHRQIARQTGWNYGCFAGDGAYRTRVYDAPLEVESVVNHRVYRGRDIVVQVAGGVRADLGEVLTKKLIAGPRMEEDAEKAQASVELPARRWWWDAK